MSSGERVIPDSQWYPSDLVLINNVKHIVISTIFFINLRVTLKEKKISQLLGIVVNRTCLNLLLEITPAFFLTDKSCLD